jgi:excisionase family DNA binding protein
MTPAERSKDTGREVMDINETAIYLGICADTLYGYALDGIVPAFKLGNRWRFRRALLNDWMDKQSMRRAPVPPKKKAK